MKKSIIIETRQGRSIENEQNFDPPSHGDLLLADSYKRRFATAKHRDTKVTYLYNCHGLTFASRRSQIWKESELKIILEDDSYQVIPSMNDVRAGDVILYVDKSGDIIHSGVVVDNEPLEGLALPIRNPWILSKWGDAHEVVHRFADCPYPAARHEFRRIIA